MYYHHAFDRLGGQKYQSYHSNGPRLLLSNLNEAQGEFPPTAAEKITLQLRFERNELVQ